MKRHYNVNPNNTFKEEVDFIIKNVPSALFKIEKSDDSKHFNNFMDEVLMQFYFVEDSPSTLHKQFRAQELFLRSINMSLFLQGLDSPSASNIARNITDSLGLELNLSSEKHTDLKFKDLTSKLGLDAFGHYLPMHALYDNTITPWGIYLYPELIEEGAKLLKSELEYDLSLEQYFVILFYAIYRHQLFHYQTERFATKLEIGFVKPFYKPYKKNVYDLTKQSERWLEEALAEASILTSILIPNRIIAKKDSQARRDKQAIIQNIYMHMLDNMPPGHCDYHCTKFGGPDEAHKVFASQLIEGREHTDYTSTSLLTVKGEFGDNDRKVPVYIVTGLHEYLKMKEFEYIDKRQGVKI